jgi:hypothetical protein
MKTTVKWECRNSRLIYRLDEIENYPPELPQLIEEANVKLRECPFCGKDTAGVFYGFDLAYGVKTGTHTPSPVHTFRIGCMGSEKNDGVLRCGCVVHTGTTGTDTDNLEDIKRELDVVVGWWNRRPTEQCSKRIA